MSLGGDKNETVNDIISEHNKLAQKENKSDMIEWYRLSTENCVRSEIWQ